MGNDRVQQFTSDGTFVQTWGEFGTGHGQFGLPIAVAVYSTPWYSTVRGTDIYALDVGDNRVQEFWEGTLSAASSAPSATRVRP
jgi:hypothetical protein